MNLKVNILKEDLFILLENIEVKAFNYTITVKEGFDFNGASIPKSLWGLFGNPLSGDFRIAALVHDVLYASQVLPRIVCDDIFLELMRLHGVNYAKRYSMYLAVRSAGGFAWSRNANECTKYTKFVSVHLKVRDEKA